MADKNYTEEQINWALEELHKKGVQNATREHAIKLLDTFDEFGNMVAGKIAKDKKSGKLKSSNKASN